MAGGGTGATASECAAELERAAGEADQTARGLTSELSLRSVIDPDQSAGTHRSRFRPTGSPNMFQSYGTVFAPRHRIPTTAHSVCSAAGPLRLIHVESIRTACEKHTLECPRCGREEIMLVAPPARGTT
jgi:hypothetical protein